MSEDTSAEARNTQITAGDGPAADAGSSAVAEASGHGGPGYIDQKEAHLKRLRRIEGQIRGLQRMVESDTYCIDVLTQVSASTRALQSFALGLLDEHLSHCVRDALAGGGTDAAEKVEEASAAIARLVRS